MHRLASEFAKEHGRWPIPGSWTPRTSLAPNSEPMEIETTVAFLASRCGGWHREFRVSEFKPWAPRARTQGDSPARSSRCVHRTSCSLQACKSIQMHSQRLSSLNVRATGLVPGASCTGRSTTTVAEPQVRGSTTGDGEGPTCLMSRPNSRGSFRPLFPATCSHYSLHCFQKLLSVGQPRPGRCLGQCPSEGRFCTKNG